MNTNFASPKRGEIYWLDWNPARGSEQAGRRPALIVQNDPFNRNSGYPNTIILALSTQGRDIPTHIVLEPDKANGLREISYIKCEQLLTVSKDRLNERVGEVTPEQLQKVDQALKRVLALL